MGDSLFMMDVAGLSAAIAPCVPGFEAFAAEYGRRVEDVAEAQDCDLCVEVTPAMIACEREMADSQHYSDAYLQTLAVQRALAEELPKHGRFLMHAAVVEFGGKAYAFTAPSGTGKSTHVRLWCRTLGDTARILNGDKPFIWVPGGEHRIEAYGTPWCGKEGWNVNSHAPLAAVCVVRRAASNVCAKVDAASALDWLGPQIYMPNNTEAAFLTLGLLDALMCAVPLYELSCDMTSDAVRASFEAMTGERFDSWRVNEEGAEHAE